MIPYYILFTLIIIGSLCDYHLLQRRGKIQSASNKSKIKYLGFVFIVLSIFMGLRAITVGIDMVQYQFRYDNAEFFFKQGFLSSEWGYNIISYFFHDILNSDFHFFIFCIAVLCIFSFFCIIYAYSPNIFISIVMYLCLGAFTLNMSAMRQTIAMSLVYLSLLEIEKRKFGAFISFVFFAFIIHNSAIIFFPFYFLWGIKISRKQGILLLILTLAAYVYKSALIPIITIFSPEKYNKYDLMSGYSINQLVILTPIFLCIYVITFMKVDKLMIDVRRSFFYILSCSQVLLLILSMNHNQIGRLSYYFSPGLYILVASVLEENKITRYKITILIECAMIVLFLLYFFISTPNGTLQIDNYRFFWESTY